MRKRRCEPAVLLRRQAQFSGEGRTDHAEVASEIHAHEERGGQGRQGRRCHFGLVTPSIRRSGCFFVAVWQDQPI